MPENETTSPAQHSPAQPSSSRELLPVAAWFAGWALGAGVIGYLTREWWVVHAIVWWLTVTLMFVRGVALRLAAIGVVLGLTVVLAYVFATS